MLDGDGMVRWNSSDSVPKDGNEILLLTSVGIVNAWFDDREPTNDAKDDGAYEWVCFDGKFTLDGHDTAQIKGWLPIKTFMR